MKDLRIRFAGSAATLAVALSALAPVGATPLKTGISRVAGSYVATHVNGSSVVRLELSLKGDGSARLQTGSSRYSQRPTGVDGGSVVETGTWHLRGGRVVLLIERASTANADSDKEQPSFAERTFILSGCELQLVGSALAFDKQHCT